MLIVAMIFVGGAPASGQNVAAPSPYPQAPESQVAEPSIPEVQASMSEPVAGEPAIIPGPTADSLRRDSLKTDSLTRDSISTKNFLEDVISGKNRDSLVYNVKDKVVYIYQEGDVSYQKMNMKADFMRIEMDTKNLLAYGVSDTLGSKTRPEFQDGPSKYTMDTITYNIGTEKARIKGVATQEGEGFLLGDNVKKHRDNSIHIQHGRYTTCDDPTHKHFYLEMTRAKVIPNKKVIIGPSYLVLEDVPLYFFLLPEGFFPMTTGRSSGVIVPSYGEEMTKGFFLRDGGYYFAMNDYADLTLKGGIYTYGSWEASASSLYRKRYKYSGSLMLRYAKTIIGEKDEAGYVNTPSFQFTWTHSQDPKNNPSSKFSASVNFANSGYREYGATNLQDYLNTSTSSTVSYQKSWIGTPFSMSANLRHNQNSRDSTYTFALPNITMNMSKVFPFKRKEAVGKQRWYEKISMSYTGSLVNNVSTKEKDLFTEKMVDDMKMGVMHTIPIQTSFNLLNYINVSPNATYRERWHFRSITREFDPEAGRVVDADTTYGFHRVWDYNVALSASTKIYGTYDFTRSETFPIRAIRHTITPTVSMSFAPDFSDPKYGYMVPVVSNANGDIQYYSPYSQEPNVFSGGGRSASMNFSIAQTLEAKVASKRDTSGVAKVKLIDNFSIGGSYNFLADSMKLSNISLNLRATLPFLKNFGLNLTATLDPYQVVDVNGSPRRINKFNFGNGKFGRIASTSWSAGYTFNSRQSAAPAINDINSRNATTEAYMNPFYFDPDNPIDPTTRRQMMTATYYDFSLPWNLGFNYSINYSNNGVTKNTTQTLGFNGSLTLTPKWSITFNGGYDFEARKLTPGVFTLVRDLHCWQMSFNWVPVGNMKSWSFNISVKSSILKDLKYDKRSSHLDNQYFQNN